MACELCGGADHPTILNCSTYVRVPQPLKDAIAQLWDCNPQQVSPGGDLEGWVYDNIYAPGMPSGQGGRWTHFFNPNYAGGLVHLIEERVYLSIRGARLLYIWNAIQPLFADPHDVVQAKHCSTQEADTRPDSIVVYLRNKASVWRFCDGLRELRQAGVISDDDFKRTTPPGTGRLPDLPGVATARQPDSEGDSFGSELCRLLASTFDASNRPVRVPMLNFLYLCLAKLKQHGIDITQPWNRPAQVI